MFQLCLLLKHSAPTATLFVPVVFYSKCFITNSVCKALSDRSMFDLQVFVLSKAKYQHVILDPVVSLAIMQHLQQQCCLHQLYLMLKQMTNTSIFSSSCVCASKASRPTAAFAISSSCVCLQCIYDLQLNVNFQLCLHVSEALTNRSVLNSSC